MSYIVKTICQAEAELMVKILPKYVRHYEQHPDSFINRILGLYKVGEYEPFIVMESLLPLHTSKLPVHLVYDLKGSWHGREIKEKEKLAKVVIYKDNDFENDPKRAFKLDKAKRDWFVAAPLPLPSRKHSHASS
jgi:hypothetical protein